MILPLALHHWLLNRARNVMESRAPDFCVDTSDATYLQRWYVTPWSRFDRNAPPGGFWGGLRRKLPNIYVHRFLRSDDDRALHDHPWPNLSILLDGWYYEHTIAAGGVHSRKAYYAGAVKARGPRSAHRIEITAPVVTIFVTGPRMRDWGFHCPAGWRRWQDFVETKGNVSKQGRGCA